MKYINTSSRLWCSYWYTLFYLCFGLNRRYMYLKNIVHYWDGLRWPVLLGYLYIIETKSSSIFYSWYWNQNTTAYVAKTFTHTLGGQLTSTLTSAHHSKLIIHCLVLPIDSGHNTSNNPSDMYEEGIWALKSMLNRQLLQKICFLVWL